MANIIEVTQLSMPELAPYTQLTQAQLRNRRHPDQGIFIAESPNVIALALQAGCQPLSLLMERKHIRGKAQDIIARCGQIPVYTGDSELLAALTGFTLTRGVLCAMARPSRPTFQQVCQSAQRIAVLDGLVDSTNVGAIFRSAAALHMDGVLLSPSCCDPLCRRAVRVSMGAVFQIPWAYLPQDYLPALHDLGFQSVAMALSSTAVDIDHPSLMAADKLAILLGTEGHGLPRETIEGCTHTACIPMAHGVDSLNVATASAVAFWQLRIR